MVIFNGYVLFRREDHQIYNCQVAGWSRARPCLWTGRYRAPAWRQGCLVLSRKRPDTEWIWMNYLVILNERYLFSYILYIYISFYVCAYIYIYVYVYTYIYLYIHACVSASIVNMSIYPPIHLPAYCIHLSSCPSIHLSIGFGSRCPWKTVQLGVFAFCLRFVVGEAGHHVNYYWYINEL